LLQPTKAPLFSFFSFFSKRTQLGATSGGALGNERSKEKREFSEKAEEEEEVAVVVVAVAVVVVPAPNILVFPE
jgi:hypothetical protein